MTEWSIAYNLMNLSLAELSMTTESYVTATQELNTILDFLRFGITKANQANLYYGHGTDNAQADMWALVLGSLFLPCSLDPVLLHARLTGEEKTLLCQRLEQRVQQRVPVPYLTHEAYFCDLTFYVDKRVLIPRSPIAELIREQFSPWIDPMSVSRILDLCTGSGCIAIACCYAFPHAMVDAVDISTDALAVAEINRQRHGVQDLLDLKQSDCFDQLPSTRYDIIVSNPPYVGDDEMQTLPREYLHEPSLALQADENGLAIVARILQHARQYLTEQGILIVEVGNSEEALIKAYPTLPFTWLDCEQGGHGIFLLTYQQLHDWQA